MINTLIVITSSISVLVSLVSGGIGLSYYCEADSESWVKTDVYCNKIRKIGFPYIVISTIFGIIGGSGLGYLDSINYFIR